MNKEDSRKILEGVEEKLKEAHVAAKLSTSEDSTDVLTVMLPEKIEGKDVFADVFFFPDDERMEGASLFSVLIELNDLSDMEKEKIGELLVKLASENSVIPIGGYGVSTTEGKLPLKTLMFKAAVPLIPGITGERMETEIIETLTLCFDTVMTSLPDIL